MEQFEDEKTYPKTNSFAIVGMVVALSSLLIDIGGIVGIVAIAFSSIALKQIKVRGQKGQGMAVAGLVIGIIDVVWKVCQLMIIISIFSQTELI